VEGINTSDYRITVDTGFIMITLLYIVYYQYMSDFVTEIIYFVLCFVLLFALFILPKFPAQGRGGCSLGSRVTFLELSSELRSDGLPATTIDLAGI